MHVTKVRIATRILDLLKFQILQQKNNWTTPPIIASIMGESTELALLEAQDR